MNIDISVKWFNDNFNIEFRRGAGEEKAFLEVKGCRIRSGQNGPFISYPARKNEETGKWWNHVWADAGFNDFIMGLADANEPEPEKEEAKDDIPF